MVLRVSNNKCIFLFIIFHRININTINMSSKNIIMNNKYPSIPPNLKVLENQRLILKFFSVYNAINIRITYIVLEIKLNIKL